MTEGFLGPLDARTPIGDEWTKKLARPERALRRSIVLEGSLAPSPRQYDLLARARAQDVRTVVVRCDDDATATLAESFGMRLLPDTAPGSRYFAGALAEALYRTYESATADDRVTMRAGFSAQIERFLAVHVKRFYSGPWASAVLGERLALAQYVHTLQNMHQYVRFTTRLLGRAVACSATTDLRAHFARHLSGEVNHEILIERDLEKLGEPTRFLKEVRYANPQTRAFMVLEQSMVSFECDPVLFVACPLAAEGITAHMDKAFLRALRASVARSTSEEVAKKATTFFSSHIETDGGDDGHWAMTLRLLEDHLPDERTLGEFLTILELAASSFTQSFDSNVEDYAIFSRPE